MVLNHAVRALAFFMIESAQDGNRKALSGKECLGSSRAWVNLRKGNLRLGRLGLAAAKFCLCMSMFKASEALADI
jgi:hypothetical protein